MLDLNPGTGRFYGAGGEDVATSSLQSNRWSAAMLQPNDLSRSLVALAQDSTIIAVVELSQSSWLVGGVLPGIERQPRKKLEPSPERLLAVLHRWRDEAIRAGCNITRIALAFEAGRDGFWLARWLAARGVEAHVIHPSSVAVSREHRRAKTDRLDTELLKRGFLGWLRGERGHCSMVRVPTLAEEDAKRPNRERECLVKERTRLVNRMKGALARLGIRNFRPTLRNAAEHLAGLYTPEGSPLPPNVAAELERDIARLGLVIGQIQQLEAARYPTARFRVIGSGPADRTMRAPAALERLPPSLDTITASQLLFGELAERVSHRAGTSQRDRGVSMASHGVLPHCILIGRARCRCRDTGRRTRWRSMTCRCRSLPARRSGSSARAAAASPPWAGRCCA